MHESFMTCNRCIPSSTKNKNLDFLLNIRWQNQMLMGSLILRSKLICLGVDLGNARICKTPGPTIAIHGDDLIPVADICQFLCSTKLGTFGCSQFTTMDVGLGMLFGDRNL
jgi:hypothetical protein